MATEKQIAANRANAQKSSGPKTEEGRARSSRNACKHGLTGAGFLVFDEEADEFKEYVTEIWAHYQPENPVEAEAVARYIREGWRLRRADRIEAAAFEARSRIGLIGYARQEIERGREQQRGWVAGGPEKIAELQRNGKEQMDHGIKMLAHHEGNLGSAFRWLCGDKDSIEQVLRYKRATEISFYCALRELERLMARRLARAGAERHTDEDDGRPT